MNITKIILKDMEELNSYSEINLNEEEIYLWIYDIRKNNKFNEFIYSLSKNEIEKANRFKFQSDKSRYILAHCFVRSVLNKYLKILPKDLVFKYNSNGKPELNNNEKNIFFNLSHSKDIVALCISKKEFVGVDVEYINNEFGYDDIVKNCFHKNEFQEWMRINTFDKAKVFYSYWTCKEAYIKAIGKGLSCPLDSFYIKGIIGNGEITVHVDGISGKKASLDVFTYEKEYMLAVALA